MQLEKPSKPVTRQPTIPVAKPLQNFWQQFFKLFNQLMQHK